MFHGRHAQILREIAEREPGLTLVLHEVNQGKGAALRTGFRHATGDVVIVQDADLEYEPEQYLQLLQPIVEGKADVVFGSRFVGETHRVLYFWHSVANKGLTMLSNMFTNLNITDMEVCYKLFRREIIQGITLRSNRFGFEPEVTAKVARFTLADESGRRRLCRIYEIPVSYHGRTYHEGKKIGIKDGFQALYCILRFAFADSVNRLQDKTRAPVGGSTEDPKELTMPRVRGDSPAVSSRCFWGSCWHPQVS